MKAIILSFLGPKKLINFLITLSDYTLILSCNESGNEQLIDSQSPILLLYKGYISAKI